MPTPPPAGRPPSDRYSRKHIHSLLACLGLSVMYPIHVRTELRES